MVGVSCFCVCMLKSLTILSFLYRGETTNINVELSKLTPHQKELFSYRVREDRQFLAETEFGARFM